MAEDDKENPFGRPSEGPYLPSEDYDAPPKRHTGLLVIGIITVCVVLGGLWVAYDRGTPQTASQVPVIQPDSKPTQVRPEQPGGMQVPNQDKMIYNQVGPNTQQGGEVERLMPGAAQPRNPPAPTTPSAPPSAQGQAAAPGPAVATQTPPPPAAAPTPEERAPEEQAPPGAATEAAAPAPAAGGAWVVQLAALKSESLAKAEWKKLEAAHKKTLGGLSSDIVRVDLGAKGVFWRLRAGPLASKADAKSLCGTLSAEKVPCLVAKR